MAEIHPIIINTNKPKPPGENKTFSPRFISNNVKKTGSNNFRLTKDILKIVKSQIKNNKNPQNPNSSITASGKMPFSIGELIGRIPNTVSFTTFILSGLEPTPNPIPVNGCLLILSSIGKINTFRDFI